MNIAVCFKTLADYQMLTDRDWHIDECQQVDLTLVRQVYNCFDESALELALQLVDNRNDREQSKVTALTIDSDRADIFLRHLYAVQYDQGVRITCEPAVDLRFNPEAVSLLIASYVQQIGNQQLVLLGSQGGVGDNRQTGYLVAERLGWPCIGDVIDAARDKAPGCLRVTSRRDGVVITQTVRLPIVLVVGNVIRSPYLRVPTLKEKLAAKNKKVLVVTPDELAVSTEDLIPKSQTLLSLVKKSGKTACTVISGESAKDKAQILYNQYLIERIQE